MMVRVLAMSREKEIRKLLQSFRRLGDGRLEWPHLAPSRFFTRGTYPAARWQVKLYVLVLHPGQAWYDADRFHRPEDVALTAARLLQERRGVWLDWAAGYRASGAVWLFVKPWAYNQETGRRVWFRPAPEDLAALRETIPKSARSKKVKVRRGREVRWR
ncbi:MAG: hypothetical protein ACUVRF_09325 [Desulfotomaculales bacterium]